MVQRFMKYEVQVTFRYNLSIYFTKIQYNTNDCVEKPTMPTLLIFLFSLISFVEVYDDSIMSTRIQICIKNCMLLTHCCLLFIIGNMSKKQNCTSDQRQHARFNPFVSNYSVLQPSAKVTCATKLRFSKSWFTIYFTFGNHFSTMIIQVLGGV